MVINAAGITQVGCVTTKPWGTWTKQLLPTGWVAAKSTRVGTRTPDGVGGQI
jgi:hypothetical protein